MRVNSRVNTIILYSNASSFKSSAKVYKRNILKMKFPFLSGFAVLSFLPMHFVKTSSAHKIWANRKLKIITMLRFWQTIKFKLLQFSRSKKRSARIATVWRGDSLPIILIDVVSCQVLIYLYRVSLFLLNKIMFEACVNPRVSIRLYLSYWIPYCNLAAGVLLVGFQKDHGTKEKIKTK